MLDKLLNINGFRWPPWALHPFYLALGLSGVLIAGSAFCSTNPVTRIQLHPNPQPTPGGGAFQVSLNDGPPVSAPGAASAFEGIVAHDPAKNSELQLQTSESELEVEIKSFPGWSALLPPRTRVQVGMPAPGELSISAFEDNHAIVRILLPDGAQAELVGRTSIRFEQFLDESYSVYAEGAVRARTADGSWLTLDTHQPPLTGGPVVQVTNVQGQVRLRRLAPCTRLQFTTTPDTGCWVNVAGSSEPGTRLKLGVATPLQLANGATIIFEAQPDGVQFNVARGYFILELPGGTQAEPHVWSGQAGRTRWDADLKAVELAAESRPILVALPHQSHAIVHPGGVLQFAKLNEHGFAASAAAGQVQLYNPVTQRTLELSQAQTQVRSRTIATHDNRLRVTIHPDPHGQLMLTEAGGGQRRLSRVEEDWAIGSGHLLRTSNDDALPLLTLQAVTGDFLMQLPFANLEFELDHLNSMNWHLAAYRPNARGHAPASNPTAVAIRGQNGQILLSPGGELMFLAPSWTMGLQPSAVFSKALEPAGSAGLEPRGPTGEGISWLLGLDPKQLHVPRIEQPPVSVVR